MERRLTVDKTHWSPSHLLAFTNLVLDTQTGKTQPHNPKAFVTSVLPYPYDKSATCPKWEKFLKEALANDESLIALARAAIRWILMPKEKDKDFEIDKAFNCNGPRGSGKGTFVTTVRSLVGPDNVGGGGPDVYGDKEKLARLVDKKLALDTDAKGYLPSSTNFNKVVSNEPVTVESKYKDSEDLTLGVVVLWASNEPIQVAKDGQEGVGRRLISIPFHNRPEKVNIHLKKELREELPGIFQWAWTLPEDEMYKTLAGPVVSDTAIETAVDQYLNSNLTLRYLSEEMPDGCDWTRAIELFKAFDKWREERQFKSVSMTTFGKELGAIEGAKKKASNGIKWSLPPMRRQSSLEDSSVPNPSTEQVYYDYADHMGIGKQRKEGSNTPTPSNGNGSTDQNGQPIQQPIHSKNQSQTDFLDS